MCNTDSRGPGTQARIVPDQEENLPKTLPLYGRGRQMGTGATCVWVLDWNVLPEKKKKTCLDVFFFFSWQFQQSVTLNRKDLSTSLKALLDIIRPPKAGNAGVFKI